MHTAKRHVQAAKIRTQQTGTTNCKPAHRLLRFLNWPPHSILSQGERTSRAIAD